jgi:hypothetical protein
MHQAAIKIGVMGSASTSIAAEGRQRIDALAVRLGKKIAALGDTAAQPSANAGTPSGPASIVDVPSGIVCAFDRLAGRNICALHGHGINLDGVRLHHRPHFLEQRDRFGPGGDRLYLYCCIAIGGAKGHKSGGHAGLTLALRLDLHSRTR